MRICVFCSASTRIDPKYPELATAAGAEMARRGHTLVSGGATVSTMGAIARAARAGGASTVGVIPQALVDHEVADEDADELIVTNDMRQRKGEMDRRSDAFLVLPGGLGTLEELLQIWTARVLGLHRKPIVVLDPHHLYGSLLDLLKQLRDQGFIRPRAFDAVNWTRTLAEAFDHLERPPAPMRATAEDILESGP